MNDELLRIRGAREHNLKNVRLDLPRNRMIVMTGISGSGKSSLAFDTIYAEGQRRYVESLSSYARQFLGQLDKPDVDLIEGLSPAISIDQKAGTSNPRSTVGTVTEIYDYLRVLYARVGDPHCYKCGRPVSRQTPQQITDRIMEMDEGRKIMVLAPLVQGRKGEHLAVLENLRQRGYVRVLVDGEVRDISDEIKLDKNKKHEIMAVVDRLVVSTRARGRVAESVEAALRLGEGMVAVHGETGAREIFSEEFACAACAISFQEMSPRMFSFNNPYGACVACGGLGHTLEIDPELVVPDKRLSLIEGAISPWEGAGQKIFYGVLEALGAIYTFDLASPFENLSESSQRAVLYGAGDEEIRVSYIDSRGRKRTYHTMWEGVIPNLQRRYRDTESEMSRQRIGMFMSDKPCPLCEGARLRPESLAVTVGGLNIAELSGLTIDGAVGFVKGLKLDARQKTIAGRLLKEVRARLEFLMDVGLDYLTLSRQANTLAGGESQRIRLATQIGSGLVGVLYILDEPSVGLHKRDNNRLIETLKRLRDLGNTVIVVEHDEDTMRSADYLVDIGPGAGIHGGHIIATGTVTDLVASKRSITGKYLSGELEIPVPLIRRKPGGRSLVVRGAAEHNLKKVDVAFPLGLFTCVTGVSGSGKSTLVSDVLYRGLQRKLLSSRISPGRHKDIEGVEEIDKVIDIDQSPIGRTPRSNPATYTKLFDAVRTLFASVPQAKVRGYKPGRFSFNVTGGRCEACKGEGVVKIEMHFLPDVYVTCDVCKGKRYDRETLEIHYKGKNIHEVLEMTVEEAMALFANIPTINRQLRILSDVGLGYVRLGQTATTLSGGEAQRIKLARELAKRATGRTLYLLDEPTTGLHFHDISKLLEVLDRLVEDGNTVVVVEHNMDVVKVADHIIDLGPEGGDRGGELVACGSPEEIAACRRSYTGKYLSEVLA
ncbi:MAG: excinuclease ABC subunit UvrA [Candidatus Anoxymicrobium japonicum]|uniref:UvrABC system protein A n=1 Tax=Candidatus Anoxymicrobium japonicum TaxID=2013648 RepID=A0A2N3G5M8_9ACTN|nr:MAG: excinuclease ABC subunit UvrA [Candidatus Anoxymicrobium japonicum]